MQHLGNFALKTIFGCVTEKELIRYTRDFDREAEAVGMLIKTQRASDTVASGAR